jgi:hypothetical protein
VTALSLPEHPKFAAIPETKLSDWFEKYGVEVLLLGQRKQQVTAALTRRLAAPESEGLLAAADAAADDSADDSADDAVADAAEAYEAAAAEASEFVAVVGVDVGESN